MRYQLLGLLVYSLEDVASCAHCFFAVAAVHDGDHGLRSLLSVSR